MRTLSFLLHISELHTRATPIGGRLSPASALQQYSRPGVHIMVPGAQGGLKMAYRHIIGDAALLATIGLMAAIIGGAF